MAVFSGNTSTSALSTAYNIAAKIKSFSLVNKSGGSLTVSVSIILGSTNTSIYSGTIDSGETYVHNGGKIKILKEAQVYVLVNGSCDYYFSIE